MTLSGDSSGYNAGASESSSSSVHALLGPTNTGKTHRAIERMLDFESGMMGLPLRLLAREVYDRVSARIGEQAVALVTGEEKRVPARPRYWICTVEAMPPDLEVDFMAIDEIQLMCHPERGHVFTDRLLHWRGRAETWFLGSDTVQGLVREQIRGVRIRGLPRLSHLTYKGQSSLRTLPRRSAVVAFSMTQVYELADVLRVRRGGAAVVLGALSPRVRNAQVALYQAGEVDFLVATDAIGMGLNLDIDHVALAAATKFDGFETRELETAELAQIVGRAGRYLRDGTFGTLSPQPELSPRTVQHLEEHRFPAQRFAYYRNSQLDFSNVPTLLAELERRPPHVSFRAPPDGDDLLVLRTLAKRAEVLSLASDEERVRALWDVCRIPNYEKRIPEHQAERILPLFEQLARRGRIASDYLDEQVRKLERYEGDIHVLLDRLSAVRMWTYVSHQGGWIDDATHWRERTRALEDRLGDLLHERLLERFVKPDSAPRRPRERTAATGVEVNGSHPFAKLQELDIYVHPEREAARKRTELVEQLVQARFEQLKLDARHDLTFEGERIARFSAGQGLLRPSLKLMLPDWIEAGARQRIERRLIAHTKDLLAHLLEPLAPQDRAQHAAEAASAPVRGLIYQLEQGLGTVSKRQLGAQLHTLNESERTALQTREIVIGRSTVFAQGMLSHDRLRIRAAWCRAALSAPHTFVAPEPDVLLWPLSGRPDPELYLRLGFVALAHWALRCDVLETLVNKLVDVQDPAGRAEETRLLLGCSDEQAQAVLAELPRSGRKRRRPGTRQP